MANSQRILKYKVTYKTYYTDKYGSTKPEWKEIFCTETEFSGVNLTLITQGYKPIIELL